MKSCGSRQRPASASVARIAGVQRGSHWKADGYFGVVALADVGEAVDFEDVTMGGVAEVLRFYRRFLGRVNSAASETFGDDKRRLVGYSSQ